MEHACAGVLGTRRPPRLSRLPHRADLLITFIISVAVFAPLCYLLVGFYRVPTGSMLQTIHLDDRVFGERVSYRFHAPAPGDIVTFRDPEDPSQNLIKRVVATTGQVVDIRDGILYVDGEPLDEPYTDGQLTERFATHGSNLEAPITYPHTVAPGSLWLMGDNRTDSLDSRFFGDVSVESVWAHALFIYWPPERIGSL